MTLDETLLFMKSNPFVKVTMPKHYRSWEYNYYDDIKQKYLTENDKEWDITLSEACNEVDGYEEKKEIK